MRGRTLPARAPDGRTNRPAPCLGQPRQYPPPAPERRHAAVERGGPGRKTRTDGSGFFGFSKVEAGEYTLKVAGASIDGRKVTAGAGQVAKVSME